MWAALKTAPTPKGTEKGRCSSWESEVVGGRSKDFLSQISEFLRFMASWQMSIP